MFPRIFEFDIFGLKIPVNSYGFMIVLGFIFGSSIAIALGKKFIKPNLIVDTGIYSLFAGLIGAKLCFVILNLKEFSESEEVFNIFDGGLNPIGAVIAGLLALFFICYKIFKKKKRIKVFSFGFLITCLVVVFLCILGARGIYLAQNWQAYKWDAFTKFAGGFVWYGGLFIGVLTALIYLKAHQAPILKVSDIAGPAVMMGLSFGRIGCFLAGCCFGRPAEHFPLAVSFPKEAAMHSSPQVHFFYPEDAPYSIKVHPTQLYEWAATFVIAIVLIILYHRKKFGGQVFSLMLILYSIWRFLVEFLRGDNLPFIFNTFTFSQVVSVAGFLCGIILYVIFLKRHLKLKKQEGIIKEPAGA
jgi:phosphatidylglycerol:prolipoprotein diacylglycerol transferase